jgi:signal transduction histidine kinase
MFIKKDQDTLYTFRVLLLSKILLITFGYCFLLLSFSLFEILPFPTVYQYLLFVFVIINLVAYYLLHKKNKYFFAFNLVLFSSIFTFSVMVLTLEYNEYRLIWFIFISIASFMFGGKKYGMVITALIIAIVFLLFKEYSLSLSIYAISSFSGSMIILSFFLYSFLTKIENDEKTFNTRIIEEIEKRQAHENTLLRQQRMTNMGEMVDAIAHQWRQPLMQSNIILLDIYETLEDKNYDNNFRRNKIKEVVDLTAHMSQTIDDFRYLLTDNKEKISFALDESIEEVLKLMKNRLANIEIISTMNEAEIFSLKNEFVQALVIIISNAIEILNNKKITNKKIYINIKEDENSFFVSIEDNAKGINKKIISKVFDAYFTTKKQDGGTGLGLHIAKILIEQNMYGKLTVQNGNYGAKFTIKIGKKDGEKFKTI